MEALTSELDARLGALQGAGPDVPCISSLDLSCNPLEPADFQALMKVITSRGARVERLRLFRCGSLGDLGCSTLALWFRSLARGQGPLELHLSHCAITSVGFTTLLDAIEKHDSVPAADRRGGWARLLYLRLEHNNIDPEAMQERVASGVIRLAGKPLGQRPAQVPLGSLSKVLLVQFDHGGSSFGQVPEDSGAPRKVPSGSEGASSAPTAGPPPPRRRGGLAIYGEGFLGCGGGGRETVARSAKRRSDDRLVAEVAAVGGGPPAQVPRREEVASVRRAVRPTAASQGQAVRPAAGSQGFMMDPRPQKLGDLVVLDAGTSEGEDEDVEALGWQEDVRGDAGLGEKSIPEEGAAEEDCEMDDELEEGEEEDGEQDEPDQVIEQQEEASADIEQAPAALGANSEPPRPPTGCCGLPADIGTLLWEAMEDEPLPPEAQKKLYRFMRAAHKVTVLKQAPERRSAGSDESLLEEWVDDALFRFRSSASSQPIPGSEQVSADMLVRVLRRMVELHGSRAARGSGSSSNLRHSRDETCSGDEGAAPQQLQPRMGEVAKRMLQHAMRHAALFSRLRPPPKEGEVDKDTWSLFVDLEREAAQCIDGIAGALDPGREFASFLLEGAADQRDEGRPSEPGAAPCDIDPNEDLPPVETDPYLML